MLLSPDLNIGIIFAFFKLSGNEFALSDRLVMCVKGDTINEEESFNNLGGMSSYPGVSAVNHIQVYLLLSSVKVDQLQCY